MRLSKLKRSAPAVFFLTAPRIQAAQRGVEARVAEEQRGTRDRVRACTRARHACQDKPPVAHMMMPLACMRHPAAEALIAR